MSAGPSVAQTQNLLRFFDACNKLKHLKRTGWVYHEVAEPETVASHMYRMSIMGMLLTTTQDGLDKVRCIKMALVHDLAESIVGDITPDDPVSKETKKQLEEEAFKRLVRDILFHDIAQPDVELKATAEEMFALWREYEDQTTRESAFVKDLDKLDMLVQANEYEREGRSHRKLPGFFASCPTDSFAFPYPRAVAEEVHRQRKDREDKHEHISDREVQK